MPKQKDIAERTLESYSDVFADIVNALLFGGRRIVRETELTDAATHSQLKIDDGLHEQERDVAKFWRNGEIRLALFGMENQTYPDVDAPLRVFSYDGASYKEQVNLHLSEKRERKPISPAYPAVTLIMYFGDKPWNAPKSLKERFVDIPPELVPFVQDYQIHVFEIAFLTPEQVGLFQSDFRLVADFLVQKRTKKEYTPPEDTIRHVDEMLKLLSAITGDLRYHEVMEQFDQRERGEITMCSVMDRAIEKGRKEGIREGIREGMREGSLEKEQTTMLVIQAIREGKSDEQIFRSYPTASEDYIRALRKAIIFPS